MTESKGDGRFHIDSILKGESLQARPVIARTDSQQEFSILPDVTLVGIGGLSIMDRGKDAILPIVEQLAQSRKRHQFMVGVGGGTRVRHTISIATDLGVPTGGIAQLIESMETVNALILNVLLAQHGFVIMNREHFWHLPLYLSTGLRPIVISSPPYRFWEPPPRKGSLPDHGFDFGLLMHAEVMGMKRVVFVKDQDGLYTRDPAKHDDAELIERTTLQAIMDDPPEDWMLDEQLFRTWRRARHVRTIQIINGLRPGLLTRALDGEEVGTIIVNEAVND